MGNIILEKEYVMCQWTQECPYEKAFWVLMLNDEEVPVH